MITVVLLFLHFKNLLSRLVDRPSERVKGDQVPRFRTPADLWDYIRKYVPYSGDPGIPYFEAETTGAFDRYTHPARTLFMAEKNRLYVDQGYQFFWPYHVTVDCDDVALLAWWVGSNQMPGFKAELLTLYGKPLAKSHVICLLTDPSGQVWSFDTSKINAHVSREAAVSFFERVFSATYTPVQTPIPFGLDR